MMDVLRPKERPVLFEGLVRPLRVEDIDSLRPILTTWIKKRDTGEPLPGEVKKDLKIMRDSAEGKENRVYLVAETPKGEVVGVIGFKDPDPRMLEFTMTSRPAELVNAYVNEEHRGGKGVGRALVGRLEEEARNKGYTEIVLNSGPRYEKTGWGFYTKIYGEPVGIAKKYYGDGGDAPVWRKEL